jgi:hypothetical protein
MKLPKISLTWKIMIGLVLGIFFGWLIREIDLGSTNHHVLGIETATLLSFIRSLFYAVPEPDQVDNRAFDLCDVGRRNFRARVISNSRPYRRKGLLYFEIVTTIALFIGLAAVNITRPGEGVSLAGTVKLEKDFDKADWSAEAKLLSKEANDASIKADELLAQSRPTRRKRPRRKRRPRWRRRKTPRLSML